MLIGHLPAFVALQLSATIRCQGWHAQVIGASSQYFAYCSTLAVYVYNVRTFALEKLLTGHERTITGLCWSPTDESLFVTCAKDRQCRVWSARTGGTEYRLDLRQNPVAVDWSSQENVIAIATDSCILLWNLATSTADVMRSSEVGQAQAIRVVRWNPRQPGFLAAGHADGSLSTYITSESKCSKLEAKSGSSSVVDLQWDALSANYALVAYKSGDVTLWDMGEETELHSFNRQGAGLCALAWMEWAPGNFATANNRTGIIRVWNVSQKHPLDTIRVAPVGFHFMKIIPGSQLALCTFTDGSLSVFHVGQRQAMFRGLAGHSETIFDLKYMPADPNVLATASYDSTVKIWNTRTPECIRTLSGQEGVIYAVSWAPGSDARLASASSEGEVCIWDTTTGRCQTKWKLHTAAVYRVDWNKLNGSVLATAGADAQVIVQDEHGTVSRTYPLPGPSFGCHWSPFNQHMLAAGCQDGIIRIYDVSQTNLLPIRTLTAHGAKVFNTIWSPLVPNVLASGSDDRTVRVWNVTSGTCTTLEGHTHNVRALVWSTELANILLSGSWDGTIRVWDTRTSTCLEVVRDHHADVYGLDVHPNHPFVFASSSRDTTLRLWDAGNLVEGLRVRAVLDRSVWAQLLGPAVPAADALPRAALSGQVSAAMVSQLATAATAADGYNLTVTFFSAAAGMSELWDLVHAIFSNRSCAVTNQVVHASDLIPNARARAQELESVKLRAAAVGMGGMRKEEQLRLAAQTYLLIGDLAKYCDLCVELDDWAAALAVAPAVSLEFWQNLCKKRAAMLAGDLSEEAVPYFIATRSLTPLVALYEQRHQLETASLVAHAESQGRYDRIPITSAAHAASLSLGTGMASGAGAASVISAQATDNAALHDSAKRECLRLAGVQAAEALARGEAVFAACHFLADSDVEGAVQCLLQGAHVDLAYAMEAALGRTHAPTVLWRLALRCERLGMLDEGVGLLRMHAATADMAPVLIVSAPLTPEEIEARFARFSLPTRKQCLAEVATLLKQGNVIAAVRAQVLGGDVVKAVTAALGVFGDLFQVPPASWNMPQIELLADICRAIPAQTLSGAYERYVDVEFWETDPPVYSVQARFLAYMSLVGALRAVANQYTCVVPALFHNTRSLIQNFGLSFPVSSRRTLLLESTFLAEQGFKRRALDVLAYRITPRAGGDEDKDDSAHKACAELAEKLRRELEDEPVEDPPVLCSPKEVVFPSSKLPTGQAKSGVTRSWTGSPILGPSIVLEDGTTELALTEAYMWSLVNPFSPLNSGMRINVL